MSDINTWRETNARNSNAAHEAVDSVPRREDDTHRLGWIPAPPGDDETLTTERYQTQSVAGMYGEVKGDEGNNYWSVRATGSGVPLRRGIVSTMGRAQIAANASINRLREGRNIITGRKF